MKRLAWLVLLSVTLNGCLYRMPNDDDEFRCVPTTNNPSVTRDPGSPLMPGTH